MKNQHITLLMIIAIFNLNCVNKLQIDNTVYDTFIGSNNKILLLVNRELANLPEIIKLTELAKNISQDTGKITIRFVKNISEFKPNKQTLFHPPFLENLDYYKLGLTNEISYDQIFYYYNDQQVYKILKLLPEQVIDNKYYNIHSTTQLLNEIIKYTLSNKSINAESNLDRLESLLQEYLCDFNLFRGYKVSANDQQAVAINKQKLNRNIDELLELLNYYLNNKEIKISLKEDYNDYLIKNLFSNSSNIFDQNTSSHDSIACLTLLAEVIRDNIDFAGRLNKLKTYIEYFVKVIDENRIKEEKRLSNREISMARFQLGIQTNFEGIEKEVLIGNCKHYNRLIAGYLVDNNISSLIPLNIIVNQITNDVIDFYIYFTFEPDSFSTLEKKEKTILLNMRDIFIKIEQNFRYVDFFTNYKFVFSKMGRGDKIIFTGHRNLIKVGERMRESFSQTLRGNKVIGDIISDQMEMKFDNALIFQPENAMEKYLIDNCVILEYKENHPKFPERISLKVKNKSKTNNVDFSNLLSNFFNIK